ncbi:hypothetical protein Q5752_001591 [Cryptotrichosporon argae]
MSPPLYTIPIADRPPGHGSWYNALFFPLVFQLGLCGINAVQFALLPLLLVPVVGRRWFRAGIEYTKDGFGRLLIAITVLFAPTSLVITTDAPPSLTGLVERDAAGALVRIHLPDRLVVMANHQAYTDWMVLWILACYAGHARGIVILLKASLKRVPIVGWGMQFFNFIFLHRSWSADRANLTRALTDLGRAAKSDNERRARSGGRDRAGEASALLGKQPRSPLWLVIFPEGTITSDEERAKSIKYATAQGVDDFHAVLHPRTTGLLFAQRTLLPQIPDLQLLDVTIGYPGVPFGRYPQEWYGLSSVFFRGVAPPAIHLHLRLYTDLAQDVPALQSAVDAAAAAGAAGEAAKVEAGATPDPDRGLARPDEARAFELWLRAVWAAKDRRMEAFAAAQRFVGSEGDDAREVVPVKQLKWRHWIAAFL